MPDDQAFAAEVVKCLQSFLRGLLAHEASLSMVTLSGADLGESEIALCLVEPSFRLSLRMRFHVQVPLRRARARWTGVVLPASARTPGGYRSRGRAGARRRRWRRSRDTVRGKDGMCQ